MRKVVAVLGILTLGACARAAQPSIEAAISRTDQAKSRAPEAQAPLRDQAAQGFGALDEKAGTGDRFQAPVASLSMIIRTGQVSVRVDSVDRAIRLIGDIAARAGGYLANTSIQRGENSEKTATLEIKIPAERYQSALESLGGIGRVLSATTTTQDVGEEFVDVTARVTNAKRLEERLINLLATRTGKLDDVLSVERELARVREEIERYEGRIRYLKSQVAMSTLSVTVFEPAPLVGTPGSNVIVEAFKQSWRNLVNATAYVIAGLGSLAPAGVALVLGLIVYRRYRRRHPRIVTAETAPIA